MAARSITVSTRSTAPPQAVFALLSDAPSWARWAGPAVPAAGWEPGRPEGAGAVRVLGRGAARVREEVIVCEPPHRYAYVLRTGQRWHHYRSDVSLQPDGAGTSITWVGQVRTRVPGLDRLLAAALRRLLDDFAQRLARAAAERA